MSKDPYDVLVKPLLTEKITSLRDRENVVAFVVRRDANRIDVKRAVEKALGAKVARVNVINVMGKNKRLGRFVGKRPDWKKAIVTLKEGEKLDLYESA